MKLVLYSSGLHHSDLYTDEYVYKELLQSKPLPKLTMLVSSPDSFAFVEEGFSSYLAPFCKPKRELIFPEQKTLPKTIDTLNDSDLIFLSGGNTYFFLNNLRMLGLDKVLINLAKAGKVLAGSSAGALIMTPTIELAAYPSYDADENEVGITDLHSLSLVPFEITPHYNSSSKGDSEFQHYTETTSRPLYALADGTAIVVNDMKQKMFGNIVMFDLGERIAVQCAC